MKSKSCVRLNKKMQKFLRDWDAVDGSQDVESVFVDQNGIGILKQLNADLRDRLDDDALQMRFRRNVGMLKDLAAEITSPSDAITTQPYLGRRNATPLPASLGRVFTALNL